MKSSLKYYSIIGSGQAATFFAAYLPLLGLKPQQIWTRNDAKSTDFEVNFKLKNASHISELAKSETLVMICTPDSSIQMLSEQIPEFDGVLAHCSGASNLDFLHLKHVNKAVIWPMASLSSIEKQNVNQVFVSIEEEGQHLKNLLKSNGLPHAEHNSHERKKLHLAAVLANNFTHHLLYKVAQMSENLQVPLEIFKNLAQQALLPSSVKEYFNGQTGPARRGDFTTQKNHLELINDPELKVLYEAFNQSIKKTYGTEL